MSKKENQGRVRVSGRMQAVAELVPKGSVAADVGTDHGYIPIYLVQQQIADRVLALDLRKGPLARAKRHIEACGLTDVITTRLSDGLKEVVPGEVDTVILSGMGGPLMIRILDESRAVVDSVSYLILQPQSETDQVRRYLAETDLRIEAEDMVEEDGKYYPMMRAVPGTPEPYEEVEFYYGKKLLEEQNPVLKQYLQKEQDKRARLLVQLSASENDNTRARICELEAELTLLRAALARY